MCDARVGLTRHAPPPLPRRWHFVVALSCLAPAGVAAVLESLGLRLSRVPALSAMLKEKEMSVLVAQG